MLPSLLQYHLLNVTFRAAYGNSNECTVQGGIKLIQPLVLKNVFHLVHDEMIKISELDAKVLIVETFVITDKLLRRASLECSEANFCAGRGLLTILIFQLKMLLLPAKECK